MDKLIYLNSLYDLYENLLTEKQRQYFKDYYFNNLSYGEISEKYEISRNASFKQLKNIEEKLIEYEEKLNLLYKKKKINDIISKVEDSKLREELENIF